MATQSHPTTSRRKRFLPALGKTVLLLTAFGLLAGALSVLGPRNNVFTQVGTVFFQVTYSATLVGSVLLAAIGSVLWLRGVRRGRRGVVLAITTIAALASVVLSTVEYVQYSNAVRNYGGSAGPFSSFTSAGTSSTPDAKAVYSQREGRDLTLSVYGRSPADDRKPVIVFVHGGGWNSGNAESLSNQHRMMADAGYVVFSINYQLSTPTNPGWDTQIVDVQNAMTWVAKHAQEYGGDKSSIVLSGESAGGTLALVYAGRVAQGSLNGPAPKAVDVMFPAIDLKWTSQHAQYMTPFVLPGIVEGYIGGSLKQYPDRLKAVSPLTFVDKRMPPVLIIHGQKDSMVTIDGSREYVSDLTKLGGTAELAEIPYSNHGTATTVNRDLTVAFLEPLGLGPR
ncbi:alpha/beta hydrolase [Curtobacterium albidum]|uniref:Alpha/beta hydrolase n=1 Tax=Curtobacterium citreum TaxID=2036 RepID=A0A850DQS1_9MICO|nr:alpha/beta hydrolase [Curtobacterium albidum]NUU27857.1 alpha/beta hydrolase [Curtobacterium albidum]